MDSIQPQALNQLIIFGQTFCFYYLLAELAAYLEYSACQKRHYQMAAQKQQLTVLFRQRGWQAAEHQRQEQLLEYQTSLQLVLIVVHQTDHLYHSMRHC